MKCVAFHCVSPSLPGERSFSCWALRSSQGLTAPPAGVLTVQLRFLLINFLAPLSLCFESCRLVGRTVYVNLDRLCPSRPQLLRVFRVPACDPLTS